VPGYSGPGILFKNPDSELLTSSSASGHVLYRSICDNDENRPIVLRTALHPLFEIFGQIPAVSGRSFLATGRSLPGRYVLYFINFN
jgi:hypothetical protein